MCSHVCNPRARETQMRNRQVNHKTQKSDSLNEGKLDKEKKLCQAIHGDPDSNRRWGLCLAQEHQATSKTYKLSRENSCRPGPLAAHHRPPSNCTLRLCLSHNINLSSDVMEGSEDPFYSPALPVAAPLQPHLEWTHRFHVSLAINKLRFVMGK